MDIFLLPGRDYVFLVKPIKNVKPRGKCTETLTKDLCCSSLQTLMNTLLCGKSGLMSHLNLVIKKPSQFVLKSLHKYLFFEAERLESHFSFFFFSCTKKMQGIAIKEIKTTSFVPLPWYLSHSYIEFSIFQYLEV